MVALLSPARALLDPLVALPEAVKARRWVLATLALAACMAFSGAAFAVRYDATRTVVRELSMKGELSKTSEQDLADAVRTAERTALVAGMAKGVIGAPLLVLLLSCAVALGLWILGVRSPFGATFATVALALLPLALFHLLLGTAALRQSSLTEAQFDKLVPANLGELLGGGGDPLRVRLLAAVDFFKLWSVALLGLGLSAATGIKRWKALLFAVVLYAMFVAVFVVGVPGMTGGGGPR